MKWSQIITALIGSIITALPFFIDLEASLGGDEPKSDLQKVEVLKDANMKCFNKKLAYFTCDKDPDCTWCEYLGHYKDQKDHCAAKLSAIHDLETDDWNCPAVDMKNEYRHCLDYIND